MRCCLVFILCCLAYSVNALAQKGISYTSMPLYKQVTVHLLGSDRQALQCYNLYGYSYTTATDSVYGEFIVRKDNDTFQNKELVNIKFCRVKELAVMVADNVCRDLPVESGIELIYPGKNEKIYLNFDPALPDAIFMPCK